MLSEFGIICLATLAMCSSSLPYQEFLHSTFLDNDESYRMLWTPSKDKLIIEVQVACVGYAGLGFSPSGGMTGADMVIGWVDTLGNVELHDLYGIGNTRPQVDLSQDYTILGGYLNDTHTVLRFSRPWVTCDEANDLILAGDTTRVIWAFSNVEPKDLSTLPYHLKDRGAKSLYLQEPKVQKALTEDLQYWDVKAPNVELPGNLETLYWCRILKIPTLKKENQIVGFTPFFQPVSNVKYVHHMVLWQCQMNNSEQVYEKFLAAKGTQCNSANMPLSWKKCLYPLAAWAVGSEGLFLPDHVGLPLGEDHGGANYFMLQMHYNNPLFDKNIVDTSGLRLYHTDRVREYDAGILLVGTDIDPRQIIPPGAMKWSSVGLCSSDCTKATLPSTGVNVTNGLLHAHLLGRGISLKQIRDGKEMPPRLKDDSYDFNYQEGRSLRPEMKILPGDSLIAECSYDSSLRKNTTFGGFSTRDEMCLIFLTYYPKANIGNCLSAPSYPTVMEPLGIQGFYPQQKEDEMEKKLMQNVIEDQQLAAMLESTSFNATEINLGKLLKHLVVNDPPGLTNLSFYDILNDRATWTSDQLTRFQDAVKMGDHTFNCLDSNLNPVNGVPKNVKYPIFEPTVPPKPICNDFMKQKASKNNKVKKIMPNTNLLLAQGVIYVFLLNCF